MKQNTKDNAVSPVVGVMLMLVVTIILAAVVASFAGGISGNAETTPIMTFTTEYSVADGLILKSTGTTESLAFGNDFVVLIDTPSDSNSFVELPASYCTIGGYTKKGNWIGDYITAGSVIYYNHDDLCEAYNASVIGNPNNGACWTSSTWQDLTGRTFTVKLMSPDHSTVYGVASGTVVN